MGSEDFGTQEITFQYGENAQSAIFNTLNYKLFPTGIYNGGLLSRVSDTTARIAPLVAYLVDSTEGLGVRVATTLNIDLDSAVSSSPYLIISYAWTGAGNNFADVVWATAGEAAATDVIIIGMANFSSGSVIDAADPFDYSERVFIDLRNAIEYVSAQEYYTDQVRYYEGEAYKSLQDENTGNQPDISPAWWEPIGTGDTTNRYDSDAAIASDLVVYLDSTSNQVSVATKATEAASRAIGITVSSTSGAGQEIAVQEAGIVIIGSGLTPGAPVFLSTAGGITEDEGTIGVTDFRVFLGYAVTATTVDLHIGEPVGGGGGGTTTVYTAAENITANDILAVDASGEAAIASKDDETLVEVVGIAQNTVGAAGDVLAQKIGLMDGFTGLTPGDPCFLDNAGAVTQDDDDVLELEYRVYLGVAKSATEIDVNIGEAVLNGPSDSMVIGSGTSFPATALFGQEFYRSDLDEWYKYNSVVWAQI